MTPTNLTSNWLISCCWLLRKCDAHSSELSDVPQTPTLWLFEPTFEWDTDTA